MLPCSRAAVPISSSVARLRAASRPSEHRTRQPGTWRAWRGTAPVRARQAGRQGRPRDSRTAGRRGEPPRDCARYGGVLQLGGNILVGPAVACARWPGRRSGSARGPMASATPGARPARFSGDAVRYAADRDQRMRKVTPRANRQKPLAPAGPPHLFRCPAAQPAPHQYRVAVVGRRDTPTAVGSFSGNPRACRKPSSGRRSSGRGRCARPAGPTRWCQTCG